MSFPRHGEIYRSDMVSKTIITWGPGAASRWSAPEPSPRTRRKGRALLIVRDEFPVGYSLAGCSPAEPASASPTGPSMRWGFTAGNHLSANGNLSLVSVSQAKGPLHSNPVPHFVPISSPFRPHFVPTHFVPFRRKSSMAARVHRFRPARAGPIRSHPLLGLSRTGILYNRGRVDHAN
jgi:hypothetical protein